MATQQNTHSQKSANFLENLVEIEPDYGSMIRATKQEITTYTVFFDEPIGPPSKYRDLIHALYNAQEGDQFLFLINSVGGSLAAAQAIIEAMKQSAATVSCMIVGDCHSAASIIMLNCEQIFVTESAWALIHTASYGNEGNSHQMKTTVDFYTVQIKKMLRATYAGFLTDEEFLDVEKGVEILLDHKEITRRLNARNEYRANGSKAKPKPKVAAPRKKKTEPATEMLTG